MHEVLGSYFPLATGSKKEISKINFIRFQVYKNRISMHAGIVKVAKDSEMSENETINFHRELTHSRIQTSWAFRKPRQHCSHCLRSTKGQMKSLKSEHHRSKSN